MIKWENYIYENHCYGITMNLGQSLDVLRSPQDPDEQALSQTLLHNSETGADLQTPSDALSLSIDPKIGLSPSNELRASQFREV